MRIDEYLVQEKIVETRNVAKQYIKYGFVKLNGAIVLKPSQKIDPNLDNHVELIQKLLFVSRAGYKLLKAIEECNLNLKDKIILDLGASTGGFCDCCLQHGAKKVYCVDVGTNQLSNSLKNRSDVINLENTNIKYLNQNMINDTIDVIVSDLCFISSKYIFQTLDKLQLAEEVNLITLVKPQYELSNEIIKKYNYCIKDKKLWDQAINLVKAYAQEYEWKVMKIIPSPIKGAKKGNQEFLMWCRKDD